MHHLVEVDTDYKIITSQLHRSYVELRLVPSLPVAVCLLQLSHTLTESVDCDLCVTGRDALQDSIMDEDVLGLLAMGRRKQ